MLETLTSILTRQDLPNDLCQDFCFAFGGHFCLFVAEKNEVLLDCSALFCSFLAKLNCWVAMFSASVKFGITPFWTCSAALPRPDKKGSAKSRMLKFSLKFWLMTRSLKIGKFLETLISLTHPKDLPRSNHTIMKSINNMENIRFLEWHHLMLFWSWIMVEMSSEIWRKRWSGLTFSQESKRKYEFFHIAQSLIHIYVQKCNSKVLKKSLIWFRKRILCKSRLDCSMGGKTDAKIGTGPHFNKMRHVKNHK